MANKKHNINELLELKKTLEEQIKEKAHFESENLQHIKEVTTDHSNDGSNREFEPRKKIELNDFTHDFMGILDQFAKIKTAIAKFNANELGGKLQEREIIRHKILFLTTIKIKMPIDKSQNTETTRQGLNNETLESKTVSCEPMFNIKEVEKQINEFSAQERKLNTEIQKLNLNAEIEIDI